LRITAWLAQQQVLVQLQVLLWQVLVQLRVLL